MRRAWLGPGFLVACGVVAVACGGDDDASIPDPTVDGGSDAAARDSASGADSAANPDTGSSVVVDAGSDAADVDAEAGVDLDAGADADADAGPQTCTVSSADATHATIQSAVDDPNCAVIHVLAGMYDEHVVVSRAVTINGDGPTTIIDGTNNGVAITVNAATKLAQMKVQNGTMGIASTAVLALDALDITGNHGSGIHQVGGSLDLCGATVVENNTVTGPSADGAGIYAQGAPLTIGCKSVVQNNIASATTGNGAGAGIFISGTGASLTIDDASVLANRAEGVTAQGAGVWAQAPITLRNNAMIADNVAHGIATTGTAVTAGGLYVERTLTATDSIITRNHAENVGGTSADGGGIYFNTGGGSLTRCHVDDNVASATATTTLGVLSMGGGIYLVDGLLTVTDSTIDGNTSTASATGATADAVGSGGGVYMLTAANKTNGLRLEGSTISNNIVTGTHPLADNLRLFGGGIRVDTQGVSTTSLVIVNSTISDNTQTPLTPTAADGGGIYAAILDGTSSVTVGIYSSTIASNTAKYGGGIYVDAVKPTTGTRSLTLANTILAANTATTGPNCLGALTSSGYNLVDSTAGCGIVTAATDVLNVAPALVALADNGGSTKTRALAAGSPAVNAADPAGCKDDSGATLATDQRGKARNGRCDIGSFEQQ